MFQQRTAVNRDHLSGVKNREVVLYFSKQGSNILDNKGTSGDIFWCLDFNNNDLLAGTSNV